MEKIELSVREMKQSFFKSSITPRLLLVVAGLSLGWLARLILGAPVEDPKPSREIVRPVSEPSEEVIDLPIIKESAYRDESGIVPPIQIPGQLPTGLASFNVTPAAIGTTEFGHDASAIFEPHGEEVCASGCAASRHPTEHLSEETFKQLLTAYTYEPIDQTNNALEELLYYGPQTRKWIETVGVGDLDSKRAEFLWEELKLTHANVTIRVTDQSGVIRSWIEPARVPLDRRHVFSMETKQVQSLVTSGTVKRVGLNHAWVRL